MSKAQDEWMDVCRRIRKGLAKRVELIEAMNGEEVKQFIESVDVAMFIEAKAQTHDDSIESRAAQLQREIAYGG